MDYKDQVVLITGAGSGIGKAAALSYAQQGATVMVSDIDANHAETTAQKILAAGGIAAAISCDVSDYVQVHSLVDQTVARYGRIDISLNNAGIGGDRERTSQFDLESWDRVIAVNQTGVFYCMREELRIMEQQQAGCIINVASIAGLKGFPLQVAYTASKHAVVGMTKTAAGEYAKMGIRINAVCPVFTHTPMVDRLLAYDESLEAKLVKTIPMRRFGEVEDIVGAIQWLSSKWAGFITGQALPVDGGLMM